MKKADKIYREPIILGYKESTARRLYRIYYKNGSQDNRNRLLLELRKLINPSIRAAGMMQCRERAEMRSEMFLSLFDLIDRFEPARECTVATFFMGCLKHKSADYVRKSCRFFNAHTLSDFSDEQLDAVDIKCTMSQERSVFFEAWDNIVADEVCNVLDKVEFRFRGKDGNFCKAFFRLFRINPDIVNDRKVLKSMAMAYKIKPARALMLRDHVVVRTRDALYDVRSAWNCNDTESKSERWLL